jgi:hypothetical protein
MIMKKTNLKFLSIVTAINVLVATGFSIAGLIHPSVLLPANSVISNSTLIFAMYAAARTIPIAVLVIWVIVKRTQQELVVLGILVGSIQFLDGFIGIYQADLGKAIGPFVLSILQLVSLITVSKKENI